MQRSSDLKKNQFYSKYKFKFVFNASSEGFKRCFSLRFPVIFLN